MTLVVRHPIGHPTDQQTWKKIIVFTTKVSAEIHLPGKQIHKPPKKRLIYLTNNVELPNLSRN